MRRGKTMEMCLFIASFILCVTCAYFYLRREDSDFKSFSENTSGLKELISGLQTQINNTKLDLTTAINAHETRITDLEDTTPIDQNVNLVLKEPLKVNVVYRPAQKIPDVPVQVKGKTPLLKRAGITK